MNFTAQRGDGRAGRRAESPTSGRGLVGECRGHEKPRQPTAETITPAAWSASLVTEAQTYTSARDEFNTRRREQGPSGVCFSSPGAGGPIPNSVASISASTDCTSAPSWVAGRVGAFPPRVCSTARDAGLNARFLPGRRREAAAVVSS
jgi:hypothetical protein